MIHMIHMIPTWMIYAHSTGLSFTWRQVRNRAESHNIMAPKGKSIKKTKVAETVESGQLVLAQPVRGAGKQRDEAAQKLDEKLSVFQKKWVGKKPNWQAIQDDFTNTERSALWMRLNSEKNRSGDPSIQEAWSQLTTMKINGLEKKRDTLALFCLDPQGSAWRDQLLTVAEEAKKQISRIVEDKEYTKGELEMLQGKDEAEWFISNEIYEQIQHPKGYTLYVKRSKGTQKIDSYTRSAKLTRNIGKCSSRTF